MPKREPAVPSKTNRVFKEKKAVGYSSNNLPGRVVHVEVPPNGDSVHIFFGRRITTELLKERGGFNPASGTFRRNRMLITGTKLTIESAVALHEILGRVLEGAGATEEIDVQLSE